MRGHVEDGDIGYIRITQFTEKTASGLRSTMEKLKSEIPADKLKGYILDLRNNPGGLLDQSIEVVNDFVDKGEIVSTRGRNPDDAQRFSARPGDDLSDGKPLVVLINGGSASASEIVAGALQDHKRATLIGTRSFGKGSVQTIMPLGEDYGALRLTTARYYTPSRPLDPGQGHHARHPGAGGRARRAQGQGREPGRGLAQGPPEERDRGQRRARRPMCRPTRSTTSSSSPPSISCTASSRADPGRVADADALAFRQRGQGRRAEVGRAAGARTHQVELRRRMRATSFVTLGVALGMSGALVAGVVARRRPAARRAWRSTGMVFEKALANYVDAPDAAKMTRARSTACWPRSIRIPTISTPRR